MGLRAPYKSNMAFQGRIWSKTYLGLFIVLAQCRSFQRWTYYVFKVLPDRWNCCKGLHRCEASAGSAGMGRRQAVCFISTMATWWNARYEFNRLGDIFVLTTILGMFGHLQGEKRKGLVRRRHRCYTTWWRWHTNCQGTVQRVCFSHSLTLTCRSLQQPLTMHYWNGILMTVLLAIANKARSYTWWTFYISTIILTYLFWS